MRYAVLLKYGTWFYKF